MDKFTKLIGKVLGELDFRKDQARKRIAEGVGEEVGKVAADMAAGAEKGFKDEISISITKSDGYRTAVKVAPYAVGTVLAIYGIDRLLDKDKDETHYRSLKRKLVGVGSLMASAALIGFGTYNQFYKN